MAYVRGHPRSYENYIIKEYPPAAAATPGDKSRDETREGVILSVSDYWHESHCIASIGSTGMQYPPTLSVFSFIILLRILSGLDI